MQVYWLGYPFTTGMPEMDHILVDKYFAPENTDWLAEDPLYMPSPGSASIRFRMLQSATSCPSSATAN